VPSHVAAVVDKALAFSPKDRWESAAAMRDAIGESFRVLTGNDVSSEPLRVLVVPRAIGTGVTSGEGHVLTPSQAEAFASSQTQAATEGRAPGQPAGTPVGTPGSTLAVPMLSAKARSVSTPDRNSPAGPFGRGAQGHGPAGAPGGSPSP